MKRIITPISIFILLATSIIPAFAGNTVAEIEYFYSDDGTIIGKAFNGKRVNYEYDLRGQLLAVKDASGNDLERYTYDPAGNRLSKTINGVTTTYSYDEANQLIRSTVNGEITYYEYDAAGRMIQAGDKSYIYNGNNKVIEVRQNGETIAKFEYNIDGQIAKAIYGDKKEEFVWDGLALIWRSGVTYINEPYVTGGNPVMAGDDVLFNDMLGSTLSVNDKAVEMTSFGETDNENAFFTGKPMIDELGYSFLFRDYNPNQGKWTTVDPLGYPDGWNNLAYCGNGVTRAIDWLGGSCLIFHAWEEVAGSFHEEETIVKVLVSHTFICGGVKEISLSFSEDSGHSISFQLQYQGIGIPISYNASFKDSRTFTISNMYPKGHDAGVEHDIRGSYVYSLKLVAVTQTVFQQCKDCKEVDVAIKNTFFRTKDTVSNEVRCVYE